MNCTPEALLQSAACYQCASKQVIRSSMIYLLCEWANHLEPTVECGTPSDVIVISGAGNAGANGTYIHNPTSTNIWNSVNDPNARIRVFGGTAFLEYGLAALELYTTPIADFPCIWTTGLDGTDPAPTGVYSAAPPFAWLPSTEIATWTDGGGVHVGDLPNFQANADTATVSAITFGATSFLTAVVGIGNLPSLSSLDVNGNSLVSLDCSGSTSITTLNCSSNASLTTLTLTGCTALVTLNCAACALTGLNIDDCTLMDSLTCSQNPFNVGTTLDLSHCTVLNNVIASSCPGLVVVNMTNITTMTGGIFVELDAALTTLTTPDIVSVGGDVSCRDCPNLSAISFPLCSTLLGDFNFYNSGVVTVSLPLVTDPHNLNGSNCPLLTTISMATMNTIYNPIDLSGCTSLVNVTLTSLSSPQGGVMFSGCTSLVNLSLPAAGLDTNGLNCSGCSALTTISIPNLSFSRDATLTGCNLNQATVDALMALYVTLLGTVDPFTINTSGGTSSAPSASGLLDKATINAFNPGVDFAITN